MKPEAALVGGGGALLGIGVGLDEGGVDVQDPPTRRRCPGPPGPPARLGAGGANPGQGVLAGQGDLLNHPPGGRHRGHRAQQPLTPDQQPQVTKAVPTVGQHHHQIPQHPGGRVPTRPASPRGDKAAQRRGQPDAVGQLGQQPHPGVADEPLVFQLHRIARLT
jgi:hypothetical protein